MSLGNRIQFVRENILKISSQIEFAKLLNVAGASTVSGWENDERRPSYEILIRISVLGKVTIDWLLKGDPEPAMVGEPAPEYKVRELEEKVNKLTEENDKLRSQLGDIDILLQVTDQIKKKLKR